MNKPKKFIGRSKELNELKRLSSKSNAALVVIKGRRRIGKSRLIEEFAQGTSFFVFSGLPPTLTSTNQSQLDEFARQLHQQTDLPEIKADDWSKLFLLLAEKVKKNKCVILLDEISWMGSKDPDFLGKLKNAWDLHFKKNPQLILILCGSVSSWIEKNIVNSTGFLGRLSLSMTLEELSLSECNQFWGKSKNISAYEKFKILSITGGVPRYLELTDPALPAETNIKQLCFSKNGPLVNEFEQIFSDIFMQRSDIYKKIVTQLVNGAASADELAAKVGLTRTGSFDEYLNDMVLAGFITRDYTWHLKTGKISKLSHYRLKDNYLRFYLKYILPNKANIEKDRYENVTLTALPGWQTIMGLQFENLVINNHPAIVKLLQVQPQDIIFANPFFQRGTTRYPGCQIDYLIQTRFHNVYVCEIKYSRHEIGTGVINEIKEKIARLHLPRHISYRAVLIHVNGVREEVIESGFFAEIIDFSEILKTS
jgi:AAA+ ATPase superfamily predicted ATPase